MLETDKSHFKYSPSSLHPMPVTGDRSIVWEVTACWILPRAFLWRIWGMAGRQEGKEAETMNLVEDLEEGWFTEGFGA